MAVWPENVIFAGDIPKYSDMARLIVKNIGPIKNVDVELKKVNVFIGPQSCGKSTLAKIISFCSWMEKEKFVGEGWEDFHASKTLQQYHKLQFPYFKEDSSILYVGDNIVYSYNNDEEWVSHLVPDDILRGMKMYDGKDIIFVGARTIYPKVMYMPAERNIVSVVPNLTKYAEGNDSTLDTIYNWYDAARNTANNQTPILDLGVSFQMGKDSVGMIMLADGTPLNLQRASSGLQSVVPLIVIMNWFSKGIYEVDKAISIEQRDRMQHILNEYFHAIDAGVKADIKKQLDQMVRGMAYTHTQFIIEEPEQNLFPETQCKLLYYILSTLNHGKNHRAVITTHSPYILYALNNCLLANIVRDNIPEEDMNVLKTDSTGVSINPSDVAVWEIADGIMKNYGEPTANHTIQDEDGLIRQNYFNDVMKRVMRDFNNLLMFKD